MQINISLPFIFNIYLVITFIHVILTAVADPDVNLPKVEFTSKKQTKGPEDPENAGKNVFWTAKDDNAKADPYWQREQRFIFKENRHAKTRTRHGPQRGEVEGVILIGKGLFFVCDTDNICLEQRIDFVIAVADFPQNFTGVLPQSRREAINAGRRL